MSKAFLRFPNFQAILFSLDNGETDCKRRASHASVCSIVFIVFMLIVFTDGMICDIYS